VSTPKPTTYPDYELVEPHRYQHEEFYWRIQDARIVIDADTDRSEQYLRAVLPLIKAEIYSIELVRGRQPNGQEFIRGAFLMNETGSVVVRISNALIGYDGSGPHLSRRILEMFGFSKEAFEMINNAARPTEQHYALILRIV
jgi:hypothetical protein